MSLNVNNTAIQSCNFNGSQVNSIYYNGILIWPDPPAGDLSSALTIKGSTGSWPTYIKPGYEMNIATNYGDVKMRLISVDEEDDGILVFQQKQAFTDGSGNVIKNGILDDNVIITDSIFSTNGYDIGKGFLVAERMYEIENNGYLWRINPRNRPWGCGAKYSIWNLSYMEVSAEKSTVTGPFTWLNNLYAVINESATVSWECSYKNIWDDTSDYRNWWNTHYPYVTNAENRVCYDENGQPVPYALRSYSVLDESSMNLLLTVAYSEGSAGYNSMIATGAVFYGVDTNGELTTIAASTDPYRFPCIAIKA